MASGRSHVSDVERSNYDETDEPLPYASIAMPIPWAIEWRLYISHSLSTWNSRSFEFGAVLFLAKIFPGTLLQLSIYAMFRSAAAILFSSKIGAAIDHRDRMAVVRTSIVLGRCSVVASAVLFYLLYERSLGISGRWRTFMFAVTVVISCVEKIASIMNLVSVERDWTAMSSVSRLYVSYIEFVLTDDYKELNARMRRIDLFCKLIGPLVIAVIDGASTEVAILITLGFNALSLPAEWFAIARVYNMVENLRLPKPAVQSRLSGLTALLQQGPLCFSEYLDALKVYIRDPAFLPSFALSLLYLTVLSFGGQMVTFLISAGFSSFIIGITRSISTIFELSATWIAPRVMLKITPVRGGMWFLSWQIICLVATLALFWHPPVNILVAPAVALTVGTILSRIGLWGFDLCAQTIIQMEVIDVQRGVFSTTEAMFQNAFELISFALTIGFSKPEQFRWPVLISVIAVCLSGVLYAWFLRRRRGHLIHFPCTEAKTDENDASGFRIRRRQEVSL